MINLPRSKEMRTAIYHLDRKHNSRRMRHREMRTESEIKMNGGKKGGGDLLGGITRFRLRTKHYLVKYCRTLSSTTMIWLVTMILVAK